MLAACYEEIITGKWKSLTLGAKAILTKAGGGIEVHNYKMLDLYLKSQKDELAELTPDMEKYIGKHFNKRMEYTIGI